MKDHLRESHSGKIEDAIERDGLVGEILLEGDHHHHTVEVVHQITHETVEMLRLQPI